MAKFISFLTQKGGTGKTTLSVLSATYFYSIGKNVTVIDVDFPQHCFLKHRTKDLEDMAANATLSEEERNKVHYPISTVQVNQAAPIMQALKTSYSLDLVFIDVPGTLNIDGIDSVIRLLDLIIIPVELEFKSIGSALDSIHTIRKFNPDVRIAFLWTKVNKVHIVGERKAFEEYIHSNFDVYIFNYILYNTVRVSRILSTTKPDVQTARELVNELSHLLENPIPRVKSEQDGQAESV